MSSEYEKGVLLRTLEFERGTWRADLRARGGLWLIDLPRGFECHDGWREIIEDLTDELVEITGGVDHAPEMRVVQIKEKLGTLRYYVWHVPDGFHDAVYAAVDRAEEKSATVCEICGAPGQLGKTGGRVDTSCPEHRDPKTWRPL